MSKKITTARFNSTCAETGCQIKKGERMMYDNEAKKCYAIASSAAVKHINDADEVDPGHGMIQANYEAYFDNFCMNNNI